MKAMLKLDKIKYAAKGMAILNDLKSHPEKMDKLEKLLRDNGFSNVADIAVELRDKYL